MKQTLRIIPQEGEYKGMVGEIQICNKCCHGKLRVQFLEIGNNELLESFNLNQCRLFIEDNV